jgi:hypothetical protein
MTTPYSEIANSFRHHKIIGDFGENLICNWLSRSGFEVTIIDHTGIDIVAYDPNTEKRLGKTVKSRTRTSSQEFSSVNLMSYQNGKNDRDRVANACKAFAAEPWIAVYVEATGYAEIYLTSLSNYDSKYRGNKQRAMDDWKMTKKNRKLYREDPEVKHIRINFSLHSWNWS